jgi:phosphate/phosphite/phosphonate ABC transporter binding protein
MKQKLEVKVLVLICVFLIIGIGSAFTFTVMFEKKDVEDITKDRMHSTSKIITKAIERSMIEADASFTRDLVRDMKLVSGFDLRIFNHKGREAFNREGEVVDDEVLFEALLKGEEQTVYEGDHLHTYMPLRNMKACRSCHEDSREIIGAVVLDISMEKEFKRINQFTWLMLGVSLAGLFIMASLLWLMIRRSIIQPVKSLESAAVKMSEGDLSFETSVETSDEIGRLDRSIKDSLYSISGILLRVKDVSKRVRSATEVVGKESRTVLEGTLLESEAVAEISSSVEELNVAIADIADNTQKLAKAAQDSAASVEEMTLSVASIKDITHGVSEGIETTTASIHQFSASIKEVVENANDLSKVSDETLSAVEEITTTVKEVEVSAKKSAQLSQKAMNDSSTLGIASIKKTMEGMESIRSSVSKTAESIQRLGGRSNEIGNILNVIDDITDQTTLLALNAAILAAQAGEHGKGFSVVANEIKDLAERTTLSTQEIGTLITEVRQDLEDAGDSMKDSIQDVDNGMLLANDTSRSLGQILDSARKSAEMSASIERTTTEQSNSARYVTDSIERVRYMVEHIVKATSEQSKGVQQIMEAAERMKEASVQADKATEQQALGSRQILGSVDSISVMSQQISKALNEQKVGSKQIWTSIDKIKNIPDENKSITLRISKALNELGRDVDLINLEMQKFSLYEEKGHGTIDMSVVPFEPPAEIYRKFKPLVEYISSKIGKRVTLRVLPDFASAPPAFKSGSPGLGFLTCVAFLDSLENAGVRPIAKTSIDGKPGHRGAIITREHSNISNISDLRGRSFAFVDEKSTSGYMLQKRMLMNAGIPLGDLGGYSFHNYHEEVVRTVLSGEADAGAVMETVALQNADKGLKVIELSESIPAFVVCSSSDMSTKQIDDVYEALIGMENAGPEAARVLESIGLKVTGFVKAVENDFDNVKDIVSVTGDM